MTGCMAACLCPQLTPEDLCHRRNHFAKLGYRLGLQIQAGPVQTKIYIACATKDLCDIKLRCHVKKNLLFIRLV